MIKSDYLLYLKSIPAFQNANNSLLSKIGKNANLVELKPNLEVNECTETDQLYIVLNGQVELSLQNNYEQLVIAVLESGEVLPFFNSSNMNIKTTKPTVLLSVSIHLLRRLMQENPALQINFLKLLQESLNYCYNVLASNVPRVQ
ncbi:cyclic nucleotide-binding domain-containing protein [Bacillus tianshenii]|nr:cyclic nucleotide-binding domain-containing protein [Bacillus tianshenii]